MRKILGVIAALWLLAAPALAQVGQAGGVSRGVVIGATSTQVLVKDDLKLSGRDYLLIQCTGLVACYCCIGTNNACTTVNGTQLAATTGAWVLTSQYRSNGIIVMAPAGDVACVTSGGASNVSVFDY